MEWTKELVIHRRRPTAQEAQLAARWLLWLSDWPEHDGPEMYLHERSEDEDGIASFMYNPLNNDCLECTPEPVEVASGTRGEVWIGLDRTGARVKVPCSREEAIAAVGYRPVPSREVFDSWPFWAAVELKADGSVRYLGQVIGGYSSDWPLERWRPVDNLGNYAPAGWGTQWKET